MADLNYIHEKVYVALDALASGSDSFESRLYNAWVSSLMRLESTDATAEVAEELSAVLMICDRHLVPNGGGMRAIPLHERDMIVRHLLKVLLASAPRNQD